MKKNNLLKVLGILCISMILLTWIIPASLYNGTVIKEGINPVGIFDIFKYPVYALATFIQYGILILAIGIFYGILSKTKSYSKLCDDIVKKVGNKKKLFLSIIIVLLSLLSSILGNNLFLFILVPFIYTLVILLGYNRKTGFAVSVGSLIVGNICSLYGSNIALISNNIFGLDINHDILIKIIFFLMVTALFVNIVIIKSRESIEEKIEIPFYKKEKSTKNIKSTLPIKVLFIFTIVISLIGIIDFSVFGFTLFKDVYNSFMNFELNGFYLFANIFKGFTQFGIWDNYDLIIFIMIMSLVISWVYSLKLEEIKDGIIEGVKNTYKVSLIAIFANIIFTVLLNTTSNILITINNFILTNDFSIAKTSITTLISSIFYNDFSWINSSGIFNMYLVYDKVNYPLISLLINSIYGIMMMILPTSLLLTTGLIYTKLDYKEWLKYIWKYLLLILLALLIIVIVLVKII